MSDLHFAAQPGGVEVLTGEAEIVVRFPAADQYGDGIEPTTVAVDLDAATARHLAGLLTAAAPSEEEEIVDAVTSVPVTLERTGGAPVKFRGREIASADGERLNGRETNRWHELTIYRTDRGRYVLHIHYRTRWQGESDRHTVAVCPTPAEVIAALRSYSPTEHVGGFPPHEVYRERQTRLEREITTQYESLVASLLAKAGFAETVD